MQITLNNRHKAGVFLTTVVAGVCLILGENFRETLGAVIIGFALTWAFGSNSKALRYCIAAIGAFLFFVPLIATLIDHHNAVNSYEKSVESFRSNLPGFAKEHPDLTAGLLPALPRGAKLNTPVTARDPLACIRTSVSDPYAAYGGSVANSRTLVVPNIGNIAFPCAMSDKDIAKALRAYPEGARAPYWYLEALDAGVSPDDIDQLTPPLDKPEAFDIKSAISDSLIVEIPSALLAILFFGSIFVEKSRTAAQQPANADSLRE